MSSYPRRLWSSDMIIMNRVHLLCFWWKLHADLALHESSLRQSVNFPVVWNKKAQTTQRHAVRISSGSVHHYTDSKASGFKPRKGSLGKETSNTIVTWVPPGSHLESQGFQRALENIARSHKSRRKEEAKENDQVHWLTIKTNILHIRIVRIHYR